MNRIILIGNGFDLAHNMKTSYKEFLLFYWDSLLKEVKKHAGEPKFDTLDFLIIDVPSNNNYDNTYESFFNQLNYSGSRIIFHNHFLKRITEKSHLNNWVDIENEYYLSLKEIINKPERSPYNKVEELNREFNQIKVKLIEYLLSIETDFDKEFNNLHLKSEIGNKIYSPFNLKDFTEDVLNTIVENEYNKSLKEESEYINMESVPSNSDSINKKKEIRNELLEENAYESIDLLPKRILFLSFNYTSTDLIYYDYRKYMRLRYDIIIENEFIHIHGSLRKEDENPIIFGFGDELDDDYNKIEQLNNNEYLENIKSIKYSETDNYKKLLEFINDDNYQIFVMGHSCGISDRTLLNTLFSHKNCGSIKTFFHKRDDQNDNFSDLVKNISRNFKDKAMMRDGVVNEVV